LRNGQKHRQKTVCDVTNQMNLQYIIHIVRRNTMKKPAEHNLSDEHSSKNARPGVGNLSLAAGQNETLHALVGHTNFAQTIPFPSLFVTLLKRIHVILNRLTTDFQRS